MGRTDTSLDVKSLLSNWRNLTSDNFLAQLVSMSTAEWSTYFKGGSSNINFTKTYDATTGIVSVSITNVVSLISPSTKVTSKGTLDIYYIETP